jgi:3-oxoacyl-(acyl-carrier-protein) synthase/thioesterase domain-containing protein
MSVNAEIAIIGMDGKYPKAESPAQLWEHIASGTDAAEEGAVGPEGCVSRYYALQGVELFDNRFFGYTPHESSLMDPQHRLMLKCAYRALEDAGYERAPAGSRTGVFATSSISTYLLNVILRRMEREPGDLDYQVLIGNDKDFLATKIAYKLDLKGPAVNIQCGCSSSLVALHYACQSLLSRDCDMALVCGVSVSVPQNRGYIYKEGGPLSRDGVCRPFDQAANGTTPGTACSAVVVKRMQDCLRDGDRIYAVVKATAVNNDGAEKIGFTAPSVCGQRSVIREALSFAGLDPSDIDYVEAHGTGTVLGDQIELAALSTAFAGSARKIPLGSLKGNIGHADVAAGITSVIKAVLMQRAEIVPPIPNLRRHNFDGGDAARQFEFPTERRACSLRYIGVSSFGIGGTNAHAVIGRPDGSPDAPRRPMSHYLIPIYLNESGDLAEYRQSILQTLDQGVDFLDFATTMAVGRTLRPITLCFVAKDREEFIRELNTAGTSGARPDTQMPRFSPDDLRALEERLPSFAHFAREMTAANGAPGAVLLSYMSRLKVPVTPEMTAWFSSANNAEPPAVKRDVLREFLEYLAAVHPASDLDLSFLYSGTFWRRTPLPHYPLHEKTYWFGDGTENTDRPQPHNEADALDGMLRIWSDALGQTSLPPDITYAESGADSLVAMEIIDAIQKTYGIQLSARELLNTLTPRQIAARIVGRKQPRAAGFVSCIRRATTGARTIFLIHPAGGSTFCYGVMNRFLTGDYGICAIDLPEDHERYSSLECLAERYLEVMRERQPSGPYLLGGYSFGGNAAYEIAAQLERRGLEVERVIMFDSHPPEAYPKLEEGAIDYESAFSKVVVEILEAGSLAFQASAVDVREFCKRWTYCFRLLQTHRPKGTVNAGAVIFAAKKSSPPEILEELRMRELDKRTWRRYFRGDVNVIPVAGDHYTIFGNSFHVRGLAKELDSLMHPLTALVLVPQSLARERPQP